MSNTPTCIPGLVPVVPVSQGSAPTAARDSLGALVDQLRSGLTVALSDEWEDCPRCEGDGVVQGLLGLKDCGECDGRGEVRVP